MSLSKRYVVCLAFQPIDSDDDADKAQSLLIKHKTERRKMFEGYMRNVVHDDSAWSLLDRNNMPEGHGYKPKHFEEGNKQ